MHLILGRGVRSELAKALGRVLTVEVEINFSYWRMVCCDHWLEKLSWSYRNLWSLTLAAKPEGIDYPKLKKLAYVSPPLG